VAHQASIANFEALALFAQRASANALQDHFVGLGIAQPDADFDAAERVCQVIDYVIKQRFQIKG